MLGLNKINTQAKKTSLSLVTLGILSMLCLLQANPIAAEEMTAQNNQVISSESTYYPVEAQKDQNQVTSATLVSHTLPDTSQDTDDKTTTAINTSTQLTINSQEKILSTYQPRPIEYPDQQMGSHQQVPTGQSIDQQKTTSRTAKSTHLISKDKGERLSSTYQPKPYQDTPATSSKVGTSPNTLTSNTSTSSNKTQTTNGVSTASHSNKNIKSPTTSTTNYKTGTPAVNKQPKTTKPTAPIKTTTPTSGTSHKSLITKPTTPTTPPIAKTTTTPRQPSAPGGTTGPTQTAKTGSKTNSQPLDRTEAIWSKNNKLTQETYTTPHWTSKEATVFINAKHPEIITAYKDAITTWNKTGAFYFHLTQDKNKANIIADERYEKNIASPLGITYSTYYMPNQQYSQANVYLNRFHVENNYYQKNGGKLLHTAQHELGHAIGLDHNSAVASVMEPTGGKTNIQPVDINNVKKLYQNL